MPLPSIWKNMCKSNWIISPQNPAENWTYLKPRTSDIYLEPQWPLFLKANPPKQGRTSNRNKGPHLGSRLPLLAEWSLPVYPVYPVPHLHIADLLADSKKFVGFTKMLVMGDMSGRRLHLKSRSYMTSYLFYVKQSNWTTCETKHGQTEHSPQTG